MVGTPNRAFFSGNCKFLDVSRMYTHMHSLPSKQQQPKGEFQTQ
jgi:hypothetical protein